MIDTVYFADLCIYGCWSSVSLFPCNELEKFSKGYSLAPHLLPYRKFHLNKVCRLLIWSTITWSIQYIVITQTTAKLATQMLFADELILENGAGDKTSKASLVANWSLEHVVVILVEGLATLMRVQIVTCDDMGRFKLTECYKVNYLILFWWVQLTQHVWADGSMG